MGYSFGPGGLSVLVVTIVLAAVGEGCLGYGCDGGGR